MRALRYIFTAAYAVIVLSFLASGVYLVGIALVSGWQGLVADESTLASRFDALLYSIGYLTIAVTALELGQTVLEEEVLRSTHVSGPTRARRFLSRFMVVVVVALGVESMVTVFHFASDDPSQLPNAAVIAVAAALLLAAWGLFVHLNRSAEELEPESMAATKREDESVKAKEDGHSRG
jgi:hypothetical protein